MHFGKTYNRNTTFNKPAFGVVCPVEYTSTSLGIVVHPPTGLRAIILAETVLAEASATLSAGEGCENIKTLSTQKVATTRTKASSKIKSADGFATCTTRNTMKEGTQDIDLHARGTTCLNALTTSVEKLNGLKDLVEGLFGNDPNALMAMPMSIIRKYFSLGKVGYVLPAYVLECAVKKRAFRSIEDGNAVQSRRWRISTWRQNRVVVSRLFAAKT